MRAFLGQDVVDLSAAQAQNGRDDRWMLADILADGECVDVKNTRFSRDGRQYWLYVKTLKRTLIGQDVRYDGVRSRIAVLPEYAGADENRGVTYLGAISLTRLNELQPASDNGLSIELRRFEREINRLPAWCFELPAVAYDGRTEVAMELLKLRRLLAKDYGVEVPETERALLASFGLAVAESDAPSEGCCKIAREVVQKGRWPAIIIRGLLSAFLDELSGGAEFSRIKSSVLLFPSDTMPLGVYDPTSSVHGWYESLRVLLEHADPALRDVRALRLMGPNYLMGVTAAGEALTLIVNCGGCGAFPLVRGTAPPCEHARRKAPLQLRMVHASGAGEDSSLTWGGSWRRMN